MGNCERCGRGLENAEQQHAHLCRYCLAGGAPATERENIVGDVLEWLEADDMGGESGLEYTEVKSGLCGGKPCIVLVLADGTRYALVPERLPTKSERLTTPLF